MPTRITIFTTQLPGLESGTPVRNLYLLKGLDKHFDVTLFCFLEHKTDEEKFKKEVHNKTYFFYLPPFDSIKRYSDFLKGKIPYVERLRRSFTDFKDLKIKTDQQMYLFHELNSYFIMEKFLNKLLGKKILDAHNIEYVRLKAELHSTTFPMNFAEKRIVETMKNEERLALKKFDQILACSDKDASYFAKYVSPKKVSVIPNGVDCDYFKPSKKTHVKGLLFMGLLSYLPNDDAIHYFVSEILPLIKSKVPNVTLSIAGKGALPWLEKYATNHSDVSLLGFVPDIRDTISQTAVCICPIRYGSGTRLKVLEYMAMGRPVVSTSIGSEGLKIKHNATIAIADTPEQFALQVIQLINNRDKAEQLGNNARELVTKKYDWKLIQQQLLNSLLI